GCAPRGSRCPVSPPRRRRRRPRPRDRRSPLRRGSRRAGAGLRPAFGRRAAPARAGGWWYRRGWACVGGPYPGFTSSFDNAGVVAVAPPPRFALVPNAIAFRDAQHGIMGTGWQACANQGGAFGCKPQGTLSITNDGGTTWRVLLRTPRPVVQVTVDGGAERARFDDGETIGSRDGGRHWAPVVVPLVTGFAGPCPPFTAAFVIKGWALCGTQSSAGNQGKYVYRLTARGWKRIAGTPFAPPVGKTYGGIGSYGYVQGIAMADDGFGVIWESRGTLYVTRDGGHDWTGL